MAQSSNDSIIQKFLNTKTPVQEPDSYAYDFIGQTDTGNGSPPPTEKSVATARLAFSKQAASQRVNQNKQALQLKQSLGIPNRSVIPTYPNQEILQTQDQANAEREGQLTQTSEFEDIDAASSRYNLNSDLFRSLIRQESGVKGQEAVSQTGVKGIAQVTQVTGDEMFKGTGIKFDVNNREHQLEAGAKYLSKHINDWQDKGFSEQQSQQLATMSYNTGFNRVSQAIKATGQTNPNMQEIEDAGLNLFPESEIKDGKEYPFSKDEHKSKSHKARSFREGVGHWKKIHHNDAGELSDFTSGRLPADTVELPSSTISEEDMNKPFTELGTPVEELEQPPVTTEKEEPSSPIQETADSGVSQESAVPEETTDLSFLPEKEKEFANLGIKAGEQLSKMDVSKIWNKAKSDLSAGLGKGVDSLANLAIKFVKTHGDKLGISYKPDEPDNSLGNRKAVEQFVTEYELGTVDPDAKELTIGEALKEDAGKIKDAVGATVVNVAEELKDKLASNIKQDPGMLGIDEFGHEESAMGKPPPTDRELGQQAYEQQLSAYAKKAELKKQLLPNFTQRLEQKNVSRAFKNRIAKLVEEPSFVSTSKVINVNGNVLSHEDKTFSAIIDGKVISNFPTEEAAAFHAISHAANKRIIAGGGYEQWSFGDLRNSLIGGAALVGEAAARLTMGDPTLNGKVREYNALKQSQVLLNDPKTDISEDDLKNYRAVKNSKVLTPELEAWQNNAKKLMHYGVSKFDAISKLDKEAQDNVQLSKDIEEYGAAWRKEFPENDSGWQGAQAAIDLIAAKKGNWEATWELLKNHKLNHVKKGVGSAAYSVAILSNSLTVGAPVLTAFILDEVRRAKVEWIEKNGEEGFTEDIEENLEWFIAAKVITQKLSLGYLDKTVGAVLPGRKAWMKKSLEHIDKITPASIKNLPGFIKKPIAVAATLGSGVAGETAQGALEPVLHAKGMGEKVKSLDVIKGGAGEGLGSVALGPIFAGARTTKGIYDIAKSPSANAKFKKGQEAYKAALETKLKQIEDQEKSINPKDLANFEALQKDVTDIEEALAQLPNSSIDRWGQDSKPKLTSNNKLIQELFKTYGPLINDHTFTIQDALNEMQQQLEDQLNSKGTELDAFEKRLPKPEGKEPTLKERLSGSYVSDLFSDESKDTSLKVRDTQYGQQKLAQIEKLENDIKEIENSDISESQKIIALDIKTTEHNKLSLQLEERANSNLLKSEKQFIKNQLAKNEEHLKSDYAAGKKGSTIQEIINTQISITAGKDISDEEVNTVIKEIQDTTEYMPLDEETEYGKGDIVDLKNTDNEEVDSSQGYIIQEVLPQQEDGKVHVRLKGIDETVPVDQLINRVRTNENPRNTLEKFESLTQRNLSDASKKLVQAEFDKFIKRYAPKDDGKGDKTFGSIDDSEEAIDALSIDETKNKLDAAKKDIDTPAEDVEFWENEFNRKVEKAKRAAKEEQDDKSLADVHEEILEGESKKWKGLAKYHQEIINAYNNLKDPVIRERNIRSITSKMEIHATNLANKLTEFKRASGMIPQLTSGMGAVVVGTIDEKSPAGVRKMNYKVQTMPLTEADAKAQAKENGVEYKEGTSFESRKSNGQFVTLISNKKHTFENFTIGKSGGLIATLEKEAEYGKFIMGSVRGYKKTSMAQKAAKQEISIKANEKVYSKLVELKSKISRVVKAVTDKDRKNIKVDKKDDKEQSLKKQLLDAEKELEDTVTAFNESENTDENKPILKKQIDALKTTIAGLKARIAEESTEDENDTETDGEDTTGEDQSSESPPPGSDETTTTVRKSSTSKKGEQLEFSFSGKNFIESATELYYKVISSEFIVNTKQNLEKALGLVDKSFTDLVRIGKGATQLGLHNLSDSDFESVDKLAKALQGLGVNAKSAKVLVDRYVKFSKRFRDTLYHSVKEGNVVKWLDENGEATKYGGVNFKIVSITDGKAKIVNPNVPVDIKPVPIEDLIDTNNYAIRQPLSLLYRNEIKKDKEGNIQKVNSKNSQGTLPNQVIFTLMIGAMTWRQRTPDNIRFGDSEFKREGFLYGGNQALNSDENAELDKLAYGYNDVAKQIGNEVARLLQLSPAKASGELTQEGIDIYFDHLIPAIGMAAIETAQGTDSESYFITDTHIWNFDEANVKGRNYNNNPKGSQAEKDGLGYRHIKVKDVAPSEEGLTAISDLIAAIGVDIKNTAGPLQSPQDINTRVSGTFGDAPQEVQRLLKKLHKVEWSKSQPMDVVSDLYADHSDVLEEILGIEQLYETDDNGDFKYKLDEKGEPQLDKEGDPIKIGLWHERDMESKEASNRDKLASLKRLVEADNLNELDKFYFTYSLQNHHRIMQEGKINPQGSKVDRFLLKSWEPKTYTEKNLWKFELAVAQNFGSDIDKQTYGESQIYFNDLITDKNVLAAVHTYQKLTKARELVKNTKGKKNTNAITAKKEAAKEFAKALSIVKSSERTKGGNMSLLQGIAGLSQYMKVDRMPSAKLGFKRTISKSFESDIVMEIDGVSNGFAMNVLQFPMWENMPEMLAKIATYFGEDTEHDLSAPDTYETLAEYVQRAMGNGSSNIADNQISWEFITGNNWKDDYNKLSIYKKNKWNYKVKKDKSESKEEAEILDLQQMNRTDAIEKKRRVRAFARRQYTNRGKKIPGWANKDAKTNKTMTDAEIAAEDKLYPETAGENLIASFFAELPAGPERTKAFNELNQARKMAGLPPIDIPKSKDKKRTKEQEIRLNKLLDKREERESKKFNAATQAFMEDYNKINNAINIVFPGFTGDAKDLRDVVKYPFIIHMYGGGIPRISNDVTRDIIKDIYSQIGTLQQRYNNTRAAVAETTAFFNQYKLTEVGEQLEKEASDTDADLKSLAKEMEDFVNALDALGAFNQDNQGRKHKVVTKQEFKKAMIAGESLNKYLNDNYLQANISTTIAPRFDHGLKTMLQPTQEARDAIVSMGGILHATFLAHFQRAYTNKLKEINKDGTERSTLTRQEITNLIKDTKGELIKVFPQYKGPLSSIDENGNTEGWIDLSKTESSTVSAEEQISLPENIDKLTSDELVKFVNEESDKLRTSARATLVKIIKHKQNFNDDLKKSLIGILEQKRQFSDERVEYRTAKQNKDGKYDHTTSQTHNTFPAQLKFIEPGVAALIRQIINMDSVLLTQTMNGDPNVKVDGKRWVGDLNVLMLHDAFMASPEQLSVLHEAYGQLFLHYNRQHSVIEKTYEQVVNVMQLTRQLDESLPDNEKLMPQIETFIQYEFFENKNKKDPASLDEILGELKKTTETVSKARADFEILASENGGLTESLQMLMQKKKASQADVLVDALKEMINDTVSERERKTTKLKPVQTEFKKVYKEHTQKDLFSDFTEEQKEDLKNSLVAPKGKISETTDLGDITKNTMQNLFDDFVKLSGDYYSNAEEESNHTNTLNSVLGILSEGFESTAGIQLTFEQIEGITQGKYSQAKERVTVSASQQAPTIRNGQSPQEVYTHELLHAMTSIAIDLDPLVRNKIEQLYGQVQDTLNRKYGRGQGYKVFLPAKTGPTNLYSSKEILMARAQYNHAFNAKESVRLHEFLAYSNTNAQLSNFMKNNLVAQRTGLFARSLETIKLVIRTIREALGQRVYKPKDATQFAEAIAITEQLVGIQNKHKSKHAQIQSKTYRALDASDQIIRNFANRAYRQLQKEIGKSGPDFKSAPRALKIATGLAWLPYITLSEENAAQAYRNDMMGKLNYTLRGLAREFGEGVLTEDMIEQLLQSKINVSKERQLAETFQIDWFNGNKKNGIKSIWKSLDPKKRHAMSTETREALTNVMLRSDISSLVLANLDLDGPAGMKKIIELLDNDDARGKLLVQIKQKLNLTGSSSALRYADELGHYLMSGRTERLAGAYQNAYSIALDHLPNPSEERVALLDAYTTLSAIKDIDPRDAKLIKDLAANEFAADSKSNGIINIMQAHISYKANSRNDLFEGDPTQMMKGYIVERMDNLTAIKIGPASDKDRMYDEGYTYSYPIGKISSDQTYDTMYINRNIPEVKDVSGIMSTTNQRNQGTTLTEILTLNPNYQDSKTGKPDIRKIKAKVKEFINYQNKLAKDLKFDKEAPFRPVRDTNNVITDYRVLMDHKNVKEIIKPDLEFQNVFAHMHSNLVDRKNTIKNDKETVHLLVHEQENLLKTYPNQFVNLLDPESAYIDRYRKLPRAIREYIQEYTENGKFMVRLDIIDKVFGYKQKDVTQLKVFEDNQHPMAKQVAGLTHYAIKETVGWGKNRVVLAMPKVIFANMFSNIAQLAMRKIPMSYIFNKIIEGIHEYKKYSKDAIELRKLEYEIDTKKLDKKTSAEAKEVKRIKVRMEGNRIHKMNEAGVDSLIIEDLNEAQLDGYWNRAARMLFKGNLKFVGDKIPRSLQTVAHTLFMTKDSLPYQYSKQVVQMTDFLGRYVMMEHSQHVLGRPFKRSLHDALEAFVLFDESLIAPLELLDSLGVTSFLSYWLRNQRAAKKLVMTNPSSVAISALTQEITGIATLGNINSAWLGGDFMPNVAQTDDMFDEANNITLFEAIAQIKGMIS